MTTYVVRPLKELGIEIDRDDPDIAILVGKPEMESFIKSDGDATYVCADCGATLLENVDAGTVQQIGFECLGCGEVLYLPAQDRKTKSGED